MVKIVYFCYIFECRDLSPKYKGRYNDRKVYFYRGYTNNIKRRIHEHVKCTNKRAYTARFKGNMRLVYLEEIKAPTLRLEKNLATKREEEIKNWSPEKIRKLILLKKDKITELINKYVYDTNVSLILPTN